MLLRYVLLIVLTVTLTGAVKVCMFDSMNSNRYVFPAVGITRDHETSLHHTRVAALK